VPSFVAPIVLDGAFSVNRCPFRESLIRLVSWRVLHACPVVCSATSIYASFARHNDSTALSTPRSTGGGFSGDAVSAPALPPPSAMRQYGTRGLTRALADKARYDPAEALPVLEKAYRSLDAPLLARIDALVSRHLGATRPEVMSQTFANGNMKRYSRDIEPRQADVGLWHARRQRARVPAAVSHIMGVDAGFSRAVVDDVCRRARSSGGLAVAARTAIDALPVRLLSPFFVDNNISAATFQRFRLFLGPGCGLASSMALRNDMNRAATEDRNRTTGEGAGAYVVSLRAAFQALIFYLRRQDQFVERALRGDDGREMVATLPFDGQVSAGCPPSSAIHDVHICFGFDNSGLLSSCKAVLTRANQLHPSIRGNSILYGVFPYEEDDRAVLVRTAAVYVPDLDTLRTGGVDVGGSRRAVRLILIGDYAFMNSWVGHKEVSSRMPCLWCTALRRRTQQNGLMVDKWGTI